VQSQLSQRHHHSSCASGPSHQTPILPISRAPPQSPSANDRTLYRILTLLALRLCKCHRPFSGRVLVLSKQMCIKYGRLVDLSEASTIRFISQSTSISSQSPLRIRTRRANIQGEMLGRDWVSRSPESQTTLPLELKEMIREMRAIPPSST